MWFIILIAVICVVIWRMIRKEAQEQQVPIQYAEVRKKELSVPAAPRWPQPQDFVENLKLFAQIGEYACRTMNENRIEASVIIFGSLREVDFTWYDYGEAAKWCREVNPAAAAYLERVRVGQITDGRYHFEYNCDSSQPYEKQEAIRMNANELIELIQGIAPHACIEMRTDTESRRSQMLTSLIIRFSR